MFIRDMSLMFYVMLLFVCFLFCKLQRTEFQGTFKCELALEFSFIFSETIIGPFFINVFFPRKSFFFDCKEEYCKNNTHVQYIHGTSCKGNMQEKSAYTLSGQDHCSPSDLCRKHSARFNVLLASRDKLKETERGTRV